MSRLGDVYWTLVSPLWERLSKFGNPNRFINEFAAASVTGRTLFAAHWCQSEVCNGGFHQFFYNSTGVLAPEAAASFRSLGMPQIALVVEAAMRWFGEPYPRNRQERIEILQAHDDKAQFRSLDETFYKLWDSENGGFLRAADSYAIAMANR